MRMTTELSGQITSQAVTSGASSAARAALSATRMVNSLGDGQIDLFVQPRDDADAGLDRLVSGLG